MTPLFRKLLGLNWFLVANMFALIAFGVLAIYSAGWMKEEASLVNAWNRQIIWVVVGTVIFFAASLIDYSWVSWGAWPVYLGGVILSLLALAAAESIHGHESWLQVGPVRFQPSQIAVAGTILLVALLLGGMHNLHPFFRNPFVKLGLAAGSCVIPFGIVLAQGDFGSAMVFLPVAAAMILVGNIPFRYMTVVALLGLSAVPWAFFFGLEPHQKTRITVFIDMLGGKPVDTQGDAYAAHYIIQAVGSGGLAGKGFLDEKTINNLGFIPKRTAINDFIFAVIAEEWGFYVTAALIAALALLLLQCLFIALYSRDTVGRLVCAGVAGLFFAHVFQHVGMNLLIMPITGIPLPFISYGGTFLLICMFLCGMVQSIWVHRDGATQRIANAGPSLGDFRG